MLKAPAFMLPTSVALVDDDFIYAKMLINTMPTTSKIIPYSVPDIFIEQKDNDFLFSEPNIVPLNENSIDDLVKNSLAKKKGFIHNMISVMIVDLHMDKMTGLEFIYQLKSPFIYKILISNFLDPKYDNEVKHAQNMGYIDAILEKGPSLKENLPKAIFTGQVKLFTLLSNKVFTNHNAYHCLSDTLFSDHFLKLIENFHPDHIWPNKDLTAFRFEKLSSSHRSAIFITTEEEIRTLLEGYNADTAHHKTIEQLSTGNFIVCAENPHNLDGADWPYYLRPAKKIMGTNTTFLYSIMEESELWTM